MTEFKRGDKAIVNLKPVIVSIRQASPDRWWGEAYYCRKCNRPIREGQLHGVSNRRDHFCLKCCEEL